MVNYFYLDSGDFLGFFATYDTARDTIIALGTFDDQKKQYNVIARESDSGFKANDMFYLIEGNAIMAYQNPDYSLKITASRLNQGLNTLQFQIMKSSDLYILNFKIQLINSLYSSVKLNANHFIPWEQDFDLVMPLDRDMIYGNGLGFRI